MSKHKEIYCPFLLRYGDIVYMYYVGGIRYGNAIYMYYVGGQERGIALAKIPCEELNEHVAKGTASGI